MCYVCKDVLLLGGVFNKQVDNSKLQASYYCETRIGNGGSEATIAEFENKDTLEDFIEKYRDVRPAMAYWV